MYLQETILSILGREVTPAVGCTEPVAIALNAAHAAQELKKTGQEPTSIEVRLSKGIFKNGMDVGIPGTDQTGLDVAAALGVALEDPSEGLELLKDIDDETRNRADVYLKEIVPHIQVLIDSKPIYVETVLRSKDHVAKAITEDRHETIVRLELDGKVVELPDLEQAKKKNGVDLGDFYQTSIDEIVTAIEGISEEKLLFLLDGLHMNLSAAKKGLEQPYGLGVGYNTKVNMEDGLVAKDLTNLAYMLTSAASDVRMSGERIPVMSSSGSGNNGLTAILPLAALHEIKNLDDATLTRSLAISHIITSYVKHYIGRLSNLCGCSIAASIGSGAAIAWVLGGKDIIGATINNVIANQAGVVCDGAKPGCALKLGTAAATAVQSALLAYRGTELKDHNGLTDPLPEKSIANLATLSSKGMGQVDLTIIDIMKERI